MAEPMTEEGLAEAERLAEAATPGPWMLGSDGVEGCEFVTGPEPVPVGVNSPHGLSVGRSEDAALIAASRTLVPELVAEVRRLRAQVADAWDEGYTAGASNQRRMWSDEPHLTPTVNPHRAALAEPAEADR